MGSIAAILRADLPPGIGEVQRMLAAAPHRGSDVEIALRGRCVLGVAYDDVGRDAWLAAGARLAAAFTGRLDNLPELLGRFLPSSSPDRVSPADALIVVFEALGDAAPAALRGVFAATVTDGSQLWCFRDHMAFGGLFFRQDAHGFYAASEAKQVVAGAGIASEPDMDVVERIFYADIDDRTPCAMKGVERLAKATILVNDGRRSRTRRYWDPQSVIETGQFAPDEIPERFDELMDQAVGRAMTGEDCISLSGGIDSPAVAAYATRRRRNTTSDQSLGALSMVFPDYPACDERAYIEPLAGRLDLELHTYEPTARPLDDILDWVRLCDGPIPIHPPAEAAEHYRLARKFGYRTLLGGDLAEFVVDRRYGLLPYLICQGRLRAAGGMVASQHQWGIRWPGIARQLALAVTPRWAIAARERLRRSRADGFPVWLDDRHVNDVNARNELPPQTRWRTEQLAFFIGPAIGTEADDVIQTVCGVRNRRPWIDVDLCEFFLSLPAETKFPEWFSKSLVRRLLRGKLPDQILDRVDKTVFNDRIMANIDYPALRHWILDPKYRIMGVRYDVLAERLDRQDFHIGDYKWAVDLAKTHAFLSQW
jgi:asparagine synthase (glutamine-hydrolysing)